MFNKKIPKHIFLSSLLSLILIILLDKKVDIFFDLVFRTLHVCETYLGDHSCYNWSDLLLTGSVFLIVNLMIVSVFLFFVNEDSFLKWYKFFKFSVPSIVVLELLYIFTFKPSSGSFTVGPSIEGFFVFVPPTIFTVISLSLFVKNRKKAL